MENALGCPSKQTNTEKKVLFNDIVRDALGPDEKKAEHFFMEIQESLNNKIEEHNIIHEDSDEPVILTNDIIQDILSESGVPEEITTEIEKSYNENFGDTPPLAEILIDNKALAAKAQKKKEEMLEKQVRILQNKLEIVQESLITSSEKSLEEAPTNSTELSSDLSTVNDIENDTVIAKTEDEIDSHIDININDTLEDTTEDLNADIVVKVNPEKVEQIETKIIDGKKYIVIPIDDNEQANVNGIETLL